MAIYKATIDIFVEVDSEPEACDGIAEALRDLLRRYQTDDQPQSCIIDWHYHEGRVCTYPDEATAEELGRLEV